MGVVAGYEVLEELGRGGMGVVYRARQLGLGRIVALKVVPHATHASPEARTRFRNEAQAIARLQHANIVSIHEIGDAGGLPYFSMEYCPGGSLACRLAHGPMEPREAAHLIRTLALAVQAAHDQQVIHRDLKPANILFGADGTPKVADFGLARRTDTTGHTASGAVLGTPSYMAPEQARGKIRELGPAVDVYALGAILYECLTGQPAFRAGSQFDTLMEVVTSPPVPPREIRPELPAALEVICLRCLEKAPADRPVSSGKLAERLDAFLAGRPIDAEVTGPPRLLQRKPSRVRRVALLSGCAILLLGLVGGVWYFNHASSRRSSGMQGVAADGDDATAAAGEDGTAEKKPDRSREEFERLGEAMRKIEEAAKQSKLCFIVYNSTGSTIAFETKAMSWAGEWSDWKKQEIKRESRVRYISLPASVAVQVRYNRTFGHDKAKPKELSINAQTFRSSANPSFEDIHCLYAFELSKDGKVLELKSSGPGDSKQKIAGVTDRPATAKVTQDERPEQKQGNPAPREYEELAKKMAAVQQLMKQTRLWFVLKNATDGPVRYKLRYLLWNGETMTGKEETIAKRAMMKVSAPPGSIRIVVLYNANLGSGNSEVHALGINAQTFRALAEPKVSDIDSKYTFQFSRDRKKLSLVWN
jgi:serine/threonine protein kinase